MGETGYDTAVRVAHLYAEEGLTQDQIAAALSLPKRRVIKINRPVLHAR